MAWKHSWWSDMGEFFHQPNVKRWNNSQMFQGYHWWWRLNVSVYSWGSCIPTPWLFNEGVLLWRHCTWRRIFSYRLPSARMVVECAFGRLKGWFGILRKDIDTDLKTTLNIIYACFVLHNFCEMNKEQLLDDIVSTAIHNNNNMQPPTQNYWYSTGTGNDIKGKKHRKIFVKYFEIFFLKQ